MLDNELFVHFKQQHNVNDTPYFSTTWGDGKNEP